MGFFQKLFSSHLRQARSAEAAGNLDLAAQQYALAEKWPECVRLHEERAKRASSRSSEIAALRDALYWSKTDELVKRVSLALGRALLAQSNAEGVKTVRDKERVREAAALLAAAERFADAGDALLNISETSEAAAYFRQGGLVKKLEVALNDEERTASRQRDERRAFSDYELHFYGGQRSLARDCLEEAIKNTDQSADYKRLLRELDNRWISRPALQLQLANGITLTLCALEQISIGRDHLGDWVLRSGGLSRKHGLVRYRQETDGANSFAISDQGSRNGTYLEDMKVAGEIPLPPQAKIQLGEEVQIDSKIDGTGALHLRIAKGLDQNQELVATRPGGEIPLHPWTGESSVVRFVEGRPLLVSEECVLNDRPVPDAHIELLTGDRIEIANLEIKVI